MRYFYNTDLNEIFFDFRNRLVNIYANEHSGYFLDSVNAKRKMAEIIVERAKMVDNSVNASNNDLKCKDLYDDCGKTLTGIVRYAPIHIVRSLYGHTVNENL